MDSKPNLWEIDDLRGYFKDKHLDKQLDEIVDHFIMEYDIDTPIIETLDDIRREIKKIREERDELKKTIPRYKRFDIFTDKELDHLYNFGKSRKYGIYFPGRPSTVSHAQREIKTAWGYYFINQKFSKYLFRDLHSRFPKSTIYKALKNLVYLDRIQKVR
jgi:hypothetical protein